MSLHTKSFSYFFTCIQILFLETVDNSEPDLVFCLVVETAFEIMKNQVRAEFLCDAVGWDDAYVGVVMLFHW